MADPEIAIALCQQEREAAGRWFIAEDMNCDGLFTITPAMAAKVTDRLWEIEDIVRIADENEAQKKVAWS